MDLQAQMYQDRMRMQAHAHLEDQDEQSSERRSSSLWSQDSLDAGKEKQAVASEPQAPAELQETIPAQVIAAAAQLDNDVEATLVNDEFPKTYSVYLKKIIVPREAEASARCRRLKKK